jgi:hypothetical protein
VATSVTAGTGEAANLQDTVLGAQKQSKGHLVLILHKGAGSVYALLLVLPDDLVDKAFLTITQRAGPMLREVGELDIS